MVGSWNGLHTLDEHAAYLYARLAEGKTIKQAVDLANDYAIGSSGNRVLNMIWRGDKFARIVTVYNAGYGVGSWFMRLS
ncbi:MAG: hypothetical protein KIS66_13115 [Fimbriimonadaceae bacterium]|nr:hypothetical protein [Fimbriimonadaceae bacterium]